MTIDIYSGNATYAKLDINIFIKHNIYKHNI